MKIGSNSSSGINRQYGSKALAGMYGIIKSNNSNGVTLRAGAAQQNQAT